MTDFALPEPPDGDPVLIRMAGMVRDGDHAIVEDIEVSRDVWTDQPVKVARMLAAFGAGRAVDESVVAYAVGLSPAVELTHVLADACTAAAVAPDEPEPVSEPIRIHGAADDPELTPRERATAALDAVSPSFQVSE